MTIELFRAAANGQVETVRSLLLNPTATININFKAPNGMTSLHAATQCRHTEVVRVLLEHGANKDIMDKDGYTVMSFTEDFLKQELFDLLHPELALARSAIEQMVQAKIDQYTASHGFTIDKETLKALGIGYLTTEAIPDIINRGNVTQYITSAIEHMTLDLLQADKIADIDSDERWNIDYPASQMLYAIAACAFFIKSTHSDITGKLPNIAWESLALYIRHDNSQYNPNFLSKINRTTVMKLVIKTLHSMLDSGELEEMRNNVENLQPTSDLSTIHALLGFLNDEYNAQYVEAAIKNYKDHSSLNSEDGRARLLMSFIEIGEALENASPRLQSLFTQKAVEHLSIIRNTLAHPERIGNCDMINNFLNGTSDLFNVGDIKIDLNVLRGDCIGRYDSICSFLQKYREFEGLEEIWQHIMAEDYANSHKYQTPHSEHTTELSKISQECRDKIEKLEQVFAGEKNKIDQVITNWFGHNNFRDKIDDKLKNPTKALTEVNTALERYKNEYEASKAKNESIRNQKDKKLMNDYENTILKQQEWQTYCNRLDAVSQDVDSQKQVTEQHKLDSINQFAIRLIDNFQNYAQHVQNLFSQLNDLQHVMSTSAGDISRGFPGHQDHPVLAFYQVMLGSLSRTVLDIDSVKTIIPSELNDILKNTIQVARGYLAHIGVREAGESLAESMDRAAVFYSNSKAIIEAIKPMEVVKYALEHNMSFDVAQAAVMVTNTSMQHGVGDGSVVVHVADSSSTSVVIIDPSDLLGQSDDSQ